MEASCQSLKELMSPSNDVRRAAEKGFEQGLEADPAKVASELLQCLSQHPDPVLRTFSAVLLRRVVEPQGKHWAKLSQSAKTAMRSGLLEALQKEPERQVTRRICHTVAQAAAPEWKELLPFATAAAGPSSPPEARCMAFFLLEKITDGSEESALAHSTSLASLYMGALSDPSPAALPAGCAALKAATALLEAIKDNAQRRQMEPLLPHMLRVLGEALTQNNEVEARELLEALGRLAGVAPMYFRKNTAELASAMITVGSACQLEFSTRSAAVELLLTVCEQAPAVMRQTPAFIPELLRVLLQMTCEVDDDQQAWCRRPYNYSDAAVATDDEDGQYGAQGLCRLAEAMHTSVLSCSLPLLQSQLQHQSWQQRCAGVWLMIALADGATTTFTEQVPSAASATFSLLQDPSPRVQYTALHLVARLSELYPALVQGQMHSQLVPLLCTLVGSPDVCESVSAHAAAAITNFAESCEDSQRSLVPYLDPLLSSLCRCLSNGSPAAQSSALGAVAMIAHKTEADFTGYYDAFIPGIKGIIAANASGAGGMGGDNLLGKALGCAGLIGAAVGKKKFTPDAAEIMQMVVARCTKDFDVIIELLSTGVGSLCNALSTDFAPYLPVFMPKLYEYLNQEVNFSLEEATAADEEMAADAVTDEDTGQTTSVVHIKGVGTKKVTMNTHAVSCKGMAARMIYEFAKGTQAGFAPYVVETAKCLKAALKFKFSEDVRGASALALGQVFRAALERLKTEVQLNAKADGRALGALLASVCSALINGLADEQHDEARSCFTGGLQQVLRCCQESGGYDAPPLLQLPITAAAIVAKQLVDQAKASMERRRGQEEQFRAEGAWGAEDNAILQESLEEEEEVMENLVDCLGYLMKGHGEAWFAVFDECVNPLFRQLLAKNQAASLRWNAHCAFADALEHCGAAAHAYLPLCFPAFMSGAQQDKDNRLRMVSVYGLSQCARSPQFLIKYINRVLPLLLMLANDDAGRGGDAVYVVENAVSALGKLCTIPELQQHVDRAKILPLWLSKLPLSEDEVEARSTNKLLCDLVEAGDQHLLGQGMLNAPKVASVIAKALHMREGDHDLADDATARRLCSLLEAMQAKMPASVQEAWGSLSEKQQQAVQRALAQ